MDPELEIHEQEAPDEILETEEDAQLPAEGEQDSDEGQVDAGDALDGEEGQESRQVAAKPKAKPEIARLREERRAERERNDRLEREMQELRAQVSRPQVQMESPDQKAARLALMTPEERISESLNETVTSMRAEQNRLAFQMQEQADKAHFAQLSATNPRAAKFADEVERQLQQFRSQGQNYPRETLLAYVVGQAVLKSAPAAVAKAKTAAVKRVDAQKVSTSNGRGDTGSGRREKDEAAARRARAESYTF